MTCRLRPYNPADAAAVAAIYAHAVANGTATFDLEPPSAADMGARLAGLAADGFPVLVAEADGGVAGYAYAALFRTRPAFRFTLEDSIYVAPAAQGRGVGRALLGELIRRCEAGPWRAMVAVIGDAASTGSIRLHESLGFSHVGVLEGVGYKHGRWLATVMMQRPLGPGASAPPTGV